MDHTFSLGCRAVRVAQREESHLNQLIEEHVLPDQNKLRVLLSAVELYGVLIVLHHTEHWQHITYNMQHRTSLTLMYSFSHMYSLFVIVTFHIFN